jgi:ribosomal protein S18 acetylase RimI-like enzyme
MIREIRKGKTCCKVNFRWMTLDNLSGVMHVDGNVSPLPLARKDFLKIMRSETCYGLLACQADEVLGYLLCDQQGYNVQILGIGVKEACWRCSVGKQLLDHIIQRNRTRNLDSEGMFAYTAVVPEKSLGALNFFKAQEFRAIEVLKDHYDAIDQDGYVMRRVY